MIFEILIMIQVHLFITGRVQGVGFRSFIKSRARKLGLTGYVQNLPDGRVEAVAQGSRDRLLMLIQDANKGSYVSEVQDVAVRWEEATELYPDFRIHRLS